MSDDASVNVGIAGSITVAVLCLATVFLLHSFYRRYKRMADRDPNLKPVIPDEDN